MILFDKKIKIHKFLNELFGREATWFDILAIFSGSVSLAIITLSVIWNVDMSLIKKVVLTFLALDIGGGVIANFTTGTNNYYAESSSRRYLFVLFHVFQPLLLIWIYPNDLYLILTIALYILLSSLCIINMKKIDIQRVIGITLLLIGILTVQKLSFSNQLLQLLLLVYSTKLVLAFSVNWTNSIKS